MYVRDLFEKYKSEDKTSELKIFWDNSEFKEYSSEWIDVVFLSYSNKSNLEYSKDVLIVEPDDLFDVYQIIKSENKDYSLSFIPWEEIFAMNISNKSLRAYSELELLCAIIFEMTFYGDEEDIVSVKLDLDDRMTNINYSKLKSFDEICKELEL